MSGSSGAMAGSAAQSFGAAVTDIFGAIGAAQSVKSYKQAAGEALLNANATGAAGLYDEAQQQRLVELTLGKQQSQVAASGFRESGTALTLLHSSQQQGALQLASMKTNVALQQASYEQQAQADYAAANAANMKAESGYFSAAMQFGQGVAETVMSMS